MSEENIYAVGTVQMIPFEYSGSKEATEYQVVGGFVVQHIIHTNLNRRDTYFIFTLRIKVLQLSLQGLIKR